LFIKRWQWIKKQKLLKENKKLKRFVGKDKEERLGEVKSKLLGVIPAEKKKDEDNQRKAIEDEEDDLEIYGDDGEFDGRIPERFYHSHWTAQDLVDVVEEQKEMIKKLSLAGLSKHAANRIMVVIDDPGILV
jgi:hypothetical protein